MEKEIAEYKKGMRGRVDNKKGEGIAIVEELGIIKNEIRGEAVSEFALNLLRVQRSH